MGYDVAALSQAIEEALIAERIFDVDGYGWLNADDHDPDFVGYAMWATSPPFETDFESAFAGKPPRWAATQREQRLVELGTDFEGLMKAARYAIGSVLIHRGTLSPNDFQPSPFEFHEINALVTLSMASDRVRDFVVLAVIEETPRANHELDQYRLALCTAKNLGLTDDVAALEALTPSVKALKDARNGAVHKVAMKAAKVQREIIERDRQAMRRSKNKPREDFVWDASALATMAREEAAAHEAEVTARIEALRRAYETTIKSGDLAFRLENALRSRRRKLGACGP